MDGSSLQARRVPDAVDALAPDGSEIRLLVSVSGASMVHCTLPPGQTTVPVRHRTVEEVWYILSGRGEVWRKLGDVEEIRAVSAGDSLNIPLGAHFQFRTVGDEPLRMVITTIPPWPGEDEAIVSELAAWR